MTDQELKVLELQKKELKRLRQERERLEIGAKLQKERLKLNELYKTDAQREKEKEEAEKAKEAERAELEARAEKALKEHEQKKREEQKKIILQNVLFWCGWGLVILLCFA